MTDTTQAAGLTDEQMEMIADEAILRVPGSNPVGRILYAIRAALAAHRQQEERKPLTLPTFWECMPKVGQGLASPLEQFIYENEPEEDGEAEEFRDSLLKVLTAHGIKGE